MTLTVEQIQQEALMLPLKEREQLTEYILKSLVRERADIDASWLAVAQQRLRAVERGESTTIDHDEVMRLVDQDLDAMELPDEDRAEIAQRLIDSLSDDYDAVSHRSRETRASLSRELRQRIDEIDRGEIELLGGREVMRELHEEFDAKWR